MRSPTERIQQNEKRQDLFQITLSKESQLILEDFTRKYGTSKSIVIDRALRFLAGQYHKKIVICYELLTEEKITTTTTAGERETYHQKAERAFNDMKKAKSEEISDEEMDSILARIESHKKQASKSKN